MERYAREPPKENEKPLVEHEEEPFRSSTDPVRIRVYTGFCGSGFCMALAFAWGARCYVTVYTELHGSEVDSSKVLTVYNY